MGSIGDQVRAAQAAEAASEAAREERATQIRAHWDLVQTWVAECVAEVQEEMAVLGVSKVTARVSFLQPHDEYKSNWGTFYVWIQPESYQVQETPEIAILLHGSERGQFTPRHLVEQQFTWALHSARGGHR